MTLAMKTIRRTMLAGIAALLMVVGIAIPSQAAGFYTPAYNTCDSWRNINVYSGRNATGTHQSLPPCSKSARDTDSIYVIYNGAWGLCTYLNGRKLPAGVTNVAWNLDTWVAVKPC